MDNQGVHVADGDPGVRHGAGPRVDDKCVDVADGDPGYRDFQPGNRRALRLFRWCRYGDTSPPAAVPNVNAAGDLWLRCLGGRWTCWLEAVSERGFPRIAQGLGPLGERPEHSVPHPMFGVGMGARGSPRNERPSPRGMDALWRGRPVSGRGWVWLAQKPSFYGGTGPAYDGETFSDVINDNKECD